MIDHFLLNYYTRPKSSNKTKENIVEEVTEEKPTKCSSTKNLNQNIQKKCIYQKKKLEQSHSF